MLHGPESLAFLSRRSNCWSEIHVAMQIVDVAIGQAKALIERDRSFDDIFPDSNIGYDQ